VGAIRQASPERRSDWLFGESGVIEVWTGEGEPTALASLLIRRGRAVLMINRRLVGTQEESRIVRWAFAKCSEHEAGFHYLTGDQDGAGA
jgi:hypothetical protein